MLANRISKALSNHQITIPETNFMSLRDMLAKAQSEHSVVFEFSSYSQLVEVTEEAVDISSHIIHDWMMKSPNRSEKDLKLRVLNPIPGVACAKDGAIFAVTTREVIAHVKRDTSHPAGFIISSISPTAKSKTLASRKVR